MSVIILESKDQRLYLRNQNEIDHLHSTAPTLESVLGDFLVPLMSQSCFLFR